MKGVALLAAVPLLALAWPASATPDPSAPQQTTAPRPASRHALGQTAAPRGGTPEDIALAALIRRAERDISLGHLDAAERGLRQASAELAARPVPDRDRILAVDSWLAMTLANRGQGAEAEAIARAIEAQAPRLGVDHPAVQRASLSLAVVAALGGRFDEASDRLRRLVDLAVLAADPETAGQLSLMLSEAYRVQGRFQDATDALALATLPGGAMAELGRLRQALDRGDDTGAITAADALLADPETPDGIRAIALPLRATALRRQAERGDAAALVEAEVSVRRALDGGLAADNPMMPLLLQESLAMTLLVGAEEGSESPRITEALALLRQIAERREALVGRDHPGAVGARMDYGVWLSVVGRRREAGKIFEALAARDDASPGLLALDRRALLDVSRATVMMRDLQLAQGYRTLRDASRRFQIYALAAERRDGARQALAQRSSVYRNQVLIGWVYANALTARQTAPRGD